MNQHTHFRKNQKFHDSLEEIRKYFRGHHDQIPEELTFFWKTIFPKPEMNDYALSLPVTKEERDQ